MVAISHADPNKIVRINPIPLEHGQKSFIPFMLSTMYDRSTRFCFIPIFTLKRLYEANETNEWTRKSRKEGLCGIVNRYYKPTTKCKKCDYCNEHFRGHIDIVPDSEYQERREEGLDYYT